LLNAYDILRLYLRYDLKYKNYINVGLSHHLDLVLFQLLYAGVNRNSVICYVEN